MTVQDPNSLRLFSSTSDFDLPNARYDKVEMSANFGRCSSSDTAAVHALFVRAGQSRWLRSDGSSKFPKLEIRKRENDLLFDGTVEFRRDANGGYLHARIAFNVSRYYAHNRGNRRRAPDTNRYGRHYKLARNAREEVRLQANSYGNADNYVQNDLIQSASETDWRALIVKIFREILEMIGSEVKAYEVRSAIFDFNRSYISQWVINSLEIYWEF